MDTTKLSSKGQVIIPKHIRAAHRWGAGLELEVVDLDGAILLRPKTPFETTCLDDVAGCLPSRRGFKSDTDIENALRDAARKAWHDGG